jgi:ribosome biogenesis GTPase / thiamine phosphate phosphatase
VLVTSPRLPPFRPRFLDRVQVACAAQGCDLVIVMNKIDLGFEYEEDEERLELFTHLGVRVLRCSAHAGTGLDEVRKLLSSGLSVVCGQSGVGKSSLLNAVQPGLGARTGELCAKWERGSHTTIVSMLYKLDGGGLVADTPGFRRFSLQGVEPDDLAALFPEMRPFIGQCAYGASCAHEDKERCAVTLALEEGKIHPDRMDNYFRIRDELIENRGYGKADSGPKRLEDLAPKKKKTRGASRREVLEEYEEE